VTRKHDDARRGVTLLARPSARVASSIVQFLDELRALEPEQYYHPRSDLHLTVLSLFTATVDHAPYLAHLDDYRAAVAESLDGLARFTVDTIGVTLTQGAVLAKGFPRDGTLTHVRERLRASLAERGLGATVDGRYRLETAHTTLVRFTAPLRNPERFVDALAAARWRPFGTTVVDRLELTLADWYQSSESSQPIAEQRLARREGW
jgi:2'-5' RNA ligase